MKTFVEHLQESKKVYSFKIGIAGDLPENFENTMETALQKYNVVKMTAGKRTPIQERPLDFPQLKNMNVTYYEVDLSYPTTVQVLQEYVGQCCGVKQSHVIVRNPTEPQELYQQAPTVGEKGLALLQNENMGGETAQDRVGTNRVMDLLKELETARTERGNNYVGEAPVGESKDVGDIENTKSPIGA